MADDPKISPDSPPAVPFDVPIYPDSPPGEPFDVPVFPDASLAPPYDVPIYSDAAPGVPFDVPTAPDGPPVRPVDVQVSFDGPSAEPHDVPVSLDAPPGVPHDVSTHADALPWDPIDVETHPDPPPIVPHDVEVSPDRPPSEPFDVPIHLDPPTLVIQSSDGAPPTIDQIISAVSRFDGGLGNFLSGLVEIDPITASGPGGGALDPRALAKWFLDYRSFVGDEGVAKFITEQTVLYALNPIVARVFDPTYFLKMLAPGSMGHARTSIDTEAGLTMETVARARDEALQIAVSSNPVRPGGDGLSDRPDLYGPENTYQDGQAYSVDSMVDSAIDGVNGLVDSPYTKSESGIRRFDASAFFEERSSGGSMLVRATAKARAASGIENVFSSRLAGSAAINGIIRVGVPGEETDGSVLSTTQDPSDVVDDDDARVPVSFTDLRQVPGKRYRSIYFRPENLQFSEAFAPDYSRTSTFGRVDPVVGYQKTDRTVSVSFDVHAMSPEDVERMYNKMVWLQSMVYPSYGTDSLMESGPIVRMRIGDAIATDLGGVPGVITSLSFDFNDSTWELRRGMKLPLMYRVQLEFLVLHDGPVGLVNGSFGVFQLPPGGNPPDRDTNLMGNPTDSRTEQAQGVTLLPGRFFKFGEPRS